MKIALKILKGLGIALIILLLAVLAGVVAVQSPKVQAFIGEKLVKSLEGKTDAEISFSSVSIEVPEAIVLKDVVIKDKAPRVQGADTLASIGLLTAKFSLKGLLVNQGVHVSRAHLKDASFVLAFEEDAESKTGSSMSLMRVFGLKSKESEKKGWGDVLTAGNIDIENFRFAMLNPPGELRQAEKGIEHHPGVINWNDFHCTIDRLKARNIKVKDSYISASVDSLKIREHDTGLNLDQVSGKVKVGKERVRIDNLKLKGSGSDFRLTRLQLDGPIADYGDFLHKIRIYGDFKDGSLLDMHTISHFGPGIDKMTAKAFVKGKVKGYVDDFTLDGFSFEELGSGVSANVNGSMTGLPQIGNCLLDFKVKKLSFTMDGLARFVKAWAPKTKLNLRNIAKGERFAFSGTVKGPFNRLGVSGKATSGIGKLIAAVTLRNTVDAKRPIVIGGNIKTDNLDLGRIINTESLGPLTMETGLEASLGKNDTRVRIDSLHISRLNAMDYDYTNIRANGTYSDKAFDGRFTCRDPNLDFLFQGVFNLSPRTNNAVYRFYANLGYADLHALHLDSRQRSKVWFTANANFRKTDGNDVLGDVRLSGISFESETGYHDVGDLSVSSHSNDDVNRIQIQSDLLEGSFVGEKSILAFVNDLRDLTVDKELPALSQEHAKAWDGASYDLSLKVHKAQELLNFLAPGVYIADGTSLGLKIEDDGSVRGDLNSTRLAYGTKYIKDVNLSLDNLRSGLNATLTSSALFFSGAELRDNTLSLHAENDSFGASYTFDNDEKLQTSADVNVNGRLSRDRQGLGIIARAAPSNIYYNGDGWNLSSGDISVKGGNVKIDRLAARHGAESILIDGGISPIGTDTLSLSLEKFGLSLLDNFTGGKPSLDGRATGSALLISPLKPAPGVLASIVCDSTRIDGRPAGTLNIESHWDNEDQAFDFSVANRLQAISNLSVDGSFKPSTKTLAASAKLLRLDLGYASFILDSVFSQIEGALSGEVSVDGKLGDLHLASRGLYLQDGLLELDFTRVPYNASGNLSVDDFGLHFDDVTLTDGTGGTGRVGGSVLWGGFKSMGLDTHVTFEDMHVISLERGVNSTLSGEVWGTGRADVMGPMHSITLDVEASTTREGTLRIPIGSSGSSSKNQLLTFVEPASEEEEDPYELMMSEGKKSVKRSSNFNVHLSVAATPEVTVHVDLGGDTSLTGNGIGTIELESRPSQNVFSLNGDYTLNSGNFHFSALGLVSRDFTIQDGSSVRFNGEVMDTELNVQGIYTTKTTLESLISDETATNRRTVNCGINITDKLRNPQLGFSIDVPDLNPATQALVESALNSDDKVQKQFIAILVTGNFLPDEESGVNTSTGTSALLSNVSGIMATQLNNILSKLDIPVDLGLNYKATDSGNDVFDVALSTQLFNNRVIVNGNIGNKQQYGISTNEVAGDVDVEIKVNKSGTTRLNLFSHSADQYSSYLDNSQRNGVGITYQREFSTLKQLFHDMFSSKAKRQQKALEAILAPDDSSVVLQVDSVGHTSIQKP